MTRATRDFVWVMRIFALIYFSGALLFFFKAEEVFYLINVGPKVLKLGQEIAMPTEHFWVTLSASMMTMLCIASLYSSVYPEVKGYVVIHLLAKVVSVAGFSYLYVTDRSLFAYGLGAVTDTLVIVVVLGFYLRGVTGRGPAAVVSESGSAPAHSGEHAAGEHSAPT